MKEDSVRSILRILAVITILVGAVLATCALVAMLGVSDVLHGAQGSVQMKMTGPMAEMGLYVVLGYATIAVWGFGLYFASETLARRIVA